MHLGYPFSIYRFIKNSPNFDVGKYASANQSSSSYFCVVLLNFPRMLLPNPLHPTISYTDMMIGTELLSNIKISSFSSIILFATQVFQREQPFAELS